MIRNLPIYSRFCGGITIRDAMNVNTGSCKKIFDFVRESDPCKQNDTHYTNINSLSETTNSIHAIKLSAFNLNNTSLIELYLDEYASIAKKNNHRILIDAEEVEIQDKINKITDHAIYNYNIYNTIFYKTYQLYRKDTLELLQNDIKKHNTKLAAKLVRGAYLQQDKKTGLIHNTKKDTDKNYNTAITLINNEYTNKNIKNNNVIIATHNQYSCNHASSLKYNFEYAQLLGMADKLSNHLIHNNKSVYKYIPYGSLYESIPYLTRRLYENYEILKYMDK